MVLGISADKPATQKKFQDKYDLPYTSSSLVRQYLLVLRTIHKLALPDRFLVATSDDAPETASERKFLSGAPATGLRTALRERARARRRRGKMPAHEGA